MEIKVQCDCGQKFKFDVEPVNGHMPFTVNCPVCGADGTARANVLLQQMPPPPPVPIAAAYAPPPPPAPAPMRPAGLSINRPQAAPPPAPTEAAADETSEDDSADEGGAREVKLGWKLWGMIILFVCLGLIGTFDKWSRRITAVKDLVSWVEGLVGGGSDAADGETVHPVLFSFGDTTVLFKHGNQAEVAAACAEFWVDRYKQKLNVSAPTNCVPGATIELFEADTLGVILPPTNGIVELIPSLATDNKRQATLLAMAEAVSRKLHCTNICALAGEESVTGTFVVFADGTPCFRCDRSLTTIGRLEKVKVEGESWAKEIGFKPGRAGYKEFSFEDAELLAKHLGFQSGDGEMPVSCLVLTTK
jgi:hypothetical protein